MFLHHHLAEPRKDRSFDTHSHRQECSIHCIRSLVARYHISTHARGHDFEFKCVIRSKSSPRSKRRVPSALNIPSGQTNGSPCSSDHSSIVFRGCRVHLGQLYAGGYSHRPALAFALRCSCRDKVIHHLDVLHSIGQYLQRLRRRRATQEIMTRILDGETKVIGIGEFDSLLDLRSCLHLGRVQRNSTLTALCARG
jgi:hypothetical protein